MFLSYTVYRVTRNKQSCRYTENISKNRRKRKNKPDYLHTVLLKLLFIRKKHARGPVA